MNYELIFVQYAWYIWIISFSFLSATIEMNSLFAYLKFIYFSFSHDVIEMILLICIFRSLAMKTESKTNEIQILNEIWIIFKWFSLCKLVFNISSQKDCEIVNEKRMKSEWSERKLISNEKWMDFIFIRDGCREIQKRLGFVLCKVVNTHWVYMKYDCKVF